MWFLRSNGLVTIRFVAFLWSSWAGNDFGCYSDFALDLKSPCSETLLSPQKLHFLIELSKVYHSSHPVMEMSTCITSLYICSTAGRTREASCLQQLLGYLGRGSTAILPPISLCGKMGRIIFVLKSIRSSGKQKRALSASSLGLLWLKHPCLNHATVGTSELRRMGGQRLFVFFFFHVYISF